MKKKVFSLVIGMAFGTLISIISGCTANLIDLVDSGLINLEQSKTGKVYIAWSCAYEQDNGFVISGVLRRRDSVGMPVKTHVDVTVLSPDGTIVDEARSSDVYVSRRVTGRGYLSFERFEVRLRSTPVRGSFIRVVSHSGRHDEATKS
jgi:hypothetical protein